mmetsp:Transcript_3610/g.6352  ORF Transcript_3610/g.6352 Transcript_3610/m.6352 type:complete len:204 (-) Transcript_3610:343-954(-)
MLLSIDRYNLVTFVQRCFVKWTFRQNFGYIYLRRPFAFVFHKKKSMVIMFLSFRCRNHKFLIRLVSRNVRSFKGFLLWYFWFFVPLRGIGFGFGSSLFVNIVFTITFLLLVVDVVIVVIVSVTTIVSVSIIVSTLFPIAIIATFVVVIIIVVSVYRIVSIGPSNFVILVVFNTIVFFILPRCSFRWSILVAWVSVSRSGCGHT